MNENRNDQSDEVKAQKQTYVRPELVKHGPVESLTQLVIGPTTSHPVGD